MWGTGPNNILKFSSDEEWDQWPLSLCLQAISALAAVLGVCRLWTLQPGKDRIRLSLQWKVKQYGFHCAFTKWCLMDLIMKCLFVFTGSGCVPVVKVGPIGLWARVNVRSRGNLHGYISVCCWHQSNGWCLMGDILRSILQVTSWIDSYSLKTSQTCQERLCPTYGTNVLFTST